MKRILYVALFGLLLFPILGVSAETTVIDEPSFLPMDPVIMAQGGSFIADVNGYSAMFYNPAGFASKKSSITLSSTSLWLYANPLNTYKLVREITNNSPDMITTINGEITTGGVGFGASEGIGIITRGLGLGIVFMMDSYMYGPNTLGIEGDLNATIGFIGGYAINLSLLGINLKIGGDLRPMVRVRVPLANNDAIGLLMSFSQGGDVMSALNDVNAYHGFGLGLDLGTIAELGPFKFGLSVRDLGGTRFYYTSDTVSAVSESFQSGGGFPEGSEVSNVYAIPMNVSAGASFHPDLGILSFLIDPSVHVDLDDIVGVIANGRSMWTLLHGGAEVKLLSLFSVRGGINQGYITMGAGVHLLFLDFNMAVFTRELGKHVGDIPNSGMTFELALRF